MSADLILWLQQHLPGLAPLMRAWTRLGSLDGYLLLAPPLYWWLGVRAMVPLYLALLLNFPLNTALKHLFGTVRPYAVDPRIANLAPAGDGTGPAFPSGHAQGSVLFWGYLGIRWRRLLPLSLVLIAGVVFSRLYLGVHWPIDLLGGAAVGLLLLGLALRLPGDLSPWGPLLGLLGLLSLGVGLLPWAEMGKAAGALAGLFWGHWGERRTVRFRPHPHPLRRLLLVVLGVVGVFALRLGLKAPLNALLPHPWGDAARYGAIVLWILWGTPALGRPLGWAEREG